MDNPNIKDLLKRGELNKVAFEAGFSRQYTAEYLNNPTEWKGSAAAAQKILSAVDKVVSERKRAEEEAQARLSQLLNESEKVA